MKSAGIAVFIMMAIVLGCSRTAHVTPLSPQKSEYHGVSYGSLTVEARQHLLDGNCTLFATTEAWPNRFREAFRLMTKEPVFALVDPGKEFQHGDKIVEPRLPWRRLIFAGVCEKNWFVYYEHGGYSPSNYVAVFTLDRHGALQLVWVGEPQPEEPGELKDVDTLRREIAEERFDETKDWVW